GGIRGFDGGKLVKGRKRHLLVDTQGLPIAWYVTPADFSDSQASPTLKLLRLSRRSPAPRRPGVLRAAAQEDLGRCGLSRQGAYGVVLAARRGVGAGSGRARAGHARAPPSTLPMDCGKKSCLVVLQRTAGQGL